MFLSSNIDDTITSSKLSKLKAKIDEYFKHNHWSLLSKIFHI